MYHQHPAIHSLQLSLLAFQIVFPGTRLSESPVVGILTTGEGSLKYSLGKEFIRISLRYMRSLQKG